ncbi:MAG: alpha/beta hydrolase [Methanosarcinales archaeon]|nr:alpha/beta hydrolase [Methanosarcinales archaeon]
MKRSLAIGIILAIIAVTLILTLTGCIAKQEPVWGITNDGFLRYRTPALDPDPEPLPEPLEKTDNYTLYEVVYKSRGADIEGLIRIPGNRSGKQVPGIVLLPGATVTKEGEQGLARYLCDIRYASIAIDQRNLGGINMEGDLRMFLNGEEPTQHKMVYDALSAAEVLRRQPEIDPDRILYLGESNGGRFAIIGCALDERARGVVAISTCGYGIDALVASARMKDPEVIRFYRSVDPDTYLDEISPRTFVMIHSLNDPVISYDSAQQTYIKIGEPKSLHVIEAEGHGYNASMNPFLEAELARVFS